MTTQTAERIALPSGLTADVLVEGSGPPLVYLHGPTGREWPPFLDDLAGRFTVYAPLHPGADDPDDLEVLEAFSDLAIYYDDLFRALNLGTPVVAGHSFGGMAAAELAAHLPDSVSRLVLIDPLGLWNDDAPVGDLGGTHPGKLGSLLFADPMGAAAQALLMPPSGNGDASDFILRRTLALAAAYHFIWAIPDRGLRRRLYRITAPTLVLWGERDAYVPPSYAGDFVQGIANATAETIPGAGHYPHLENREATRDAVLRFLA